LNRTAILTAGVACAAIVGACNNDTRSQRAASSAKADESLTLRSEPILPLPKPPDAAPALVKLGKALFEDKRLSVKGTVSCASCHDVANGGDDGLALSKGADGQDGKVNAPTVLNSGFQTALFWDGRAGTLEEQVGFPLTDPLEMASTWDHALGAIRADAGYRDRFAAAFPDGITEANVRTAIATYERALVTPSRFDRWLGGDNQALSADERAGYELFKSVGCTACHQGVNVGGNMYQRFGVMGDYFADRGNVTERDFGRYNVTKKESDKFVFRVPSLRNIALTAPYFHDGSAKTLGDAVRTMARYQLGRPLADAQVELIEKFLKSLDGDVSAELKGDG
jgi:cytochrome c peroxidase